MSTTVSSTQSTRNRILGIFFSQVTGIRIPRILFRQQRVKKNQHRIFWGRIVVFFGVNNFIICMKKVQTFYCCF